MLDSGAELSRRHPEVDLETVGNGRRVPGLARKLSDDELFLTLEQAMNLTGMTRKRLINLVVRRKVAYRGSQADPLLPISEVKFLAQWPIGVSPADLPDVPDVPQHEGGAAGFELDRIVEGNALDVISEMPSEIVQAVVTSPPFWGQRVYEDEKPVRWRDGRIDPFGRESKPEGYVAHSLEILAALARVMRPDGTIWWNLGDSYMTRAIARTSSADRIKHYAGQRTTWAQNPNRRHSAGHSYLKDKDLTLIPFQVALGAQHLGYWVRSLIVWSKQPHSSDHNDGNGDRGSHVPEVVSDRPVVGHEYILLLSRSERYDYYPSHSWTFTTVNGDRTPLNARTVWTFKPVEGPGAHGARFPSELPRRCIVLGTEEGDLVFDPFAGQGTTLVEAVKLKRRYFGCDISPTYVREAMESLSQLELKLAQE